jgi:hypothetical protein
VTAEQLAAGRAKVSGLDDEMEDAVAKMLAILEPYDSKTLVNLDVGTVRGFYEAFLTNRRSGRLYREMLENLTDQQGTLIRILQRTAAIQALIGFAVGLALGIVFVLALHLGP